VPGGIRVLREPSPVPPAEVETHELATRKRLRVRGLRRIRRGPRRIPEGPRLSSDTASSGVSRV